MVLVHVHRFHQPTNKTTHAQSAPPISVIFFHAIPHKPNNHLRTIPQTKSTVRARNPPKRIRRGGACVPARTSAQRRSHTKKGLCITHCVRGMNDECALVGRHGRAHRLRPYPSPSYFSTQSYTNKITIYTQSTQRKPTVHVQSAPTHLHQTARCVITPSGLYFRKRRVGKYNAAYPG